MGKQNVLAGVIVLVLVVGPVAGAVYYETALRPSRMAEQGIVELDAVSPEIGNWNPQELHLEAGKSYEIRIRSVDVAHGFQLTHHLSTGLIHPGEVKVLTFQENEEGVFVFSCTVQCPGHEAMVGRIVVS